MMAGRLDRLYFLDRGYLQLSVAVPFRLRFETTPVIVAGCVVAFTQVATPGFVVPLEIVVSVVSDVLHESTGKIDGTAHPVGYCNIPEYCTWFPGAAAA
jgi:hypothetical protein